MKVLELFVRVLLTGLLVYGLGALLAWDTDMRNWTPFGRMVFILVWAFSTVVGYLVKNNDI